MKITQTRFTGRDTSLDPIVYSRIRPQVEERSGVYRPLLPLKDEQPLKAVSHQILGDIASLRDKDHQIAERMNGLTAELSALQALQDELDSQNALLLKEQASALISGAEADEAPYRSKIANLTDQIRLKGKHADVTKAALTALQGKRDKVAASLTELESELSRANAQWLDARHNALIEKFRLEFHKLHITFSDLLAVENSAFYRGHDQAYRFLERLSSAVAYDSPFRPDWLNAAGSRKSFPGFSSALASLEAEMNLDEDMSA